MKEIHDVAELAAHLASGESLTGVRLQAIDLTSFTDELLTRIDTQRLVVLGGVVPEVLDAHLRSHGAVIFPEDPSVPVEPYRGRLYTPDQLYEGLQEKGYDATPDALAYHWLQDGRVSHDAVVTMTRAIHDDSMSDALGEALVDRQVVGVMGGHAMTRGSEDYAGAARLGWNLARQGLVVLTGGGPGAMEAANLGAFVWSRGGTEETLTQAIHRVAGVPSFRPSITEWVRRALTVRHELDGQRTVAGQRFSSVGMPTWFYGHEPPNVFCDGIAKYFSNAVREDGILARSNAGIVVLPGAAGTVQEIFQAVTPRYYAGAEAPLSPLVLVDEIHWTQDVPVWPALRAMAAGRRFDAFVHLVDSIDDALPLLHA